MVRRRCDTSLDYFNAASRRTYSRLVLRSGPPLIRTPAGWCAFLSPDVVHPKTVRMESSYNILKRKPGARRRGSLKVVPFTVMSVSCCGLASNHKREVRFCSCWSR
ncbi:hypothetical protein GQ43DRAFT_309685 [Delitschia confertaspora ATCC 74209]|uniref:Uncharacterized protein n=1 Tax=Delitschia confertaspora ATCC 74209 TaxID=1513339 RepID=A0A9P4JYG8_9PLEO|nr:hypothetical protein GQ43DRAFT_309685 [Delitschia confertaspora ATCC 74209]